VFNGVPVTVVAKLVCAHTLAKQRSGSGDQHQGLTEFRRNLSLLHDVQSIRRHIVRGVEDKNLNVYMYVREGQHEADPRQLWWYSNFRVRVQDADLMLSMLSKVTERRNLPSTM
jgi:hypothetical protein